MGVGWRTRRWGGRVMVSRVRGDDNFDTSNEKFWTFANTLALGNINTAFGSFDYRHVETVNLISGVDNLIQAFVNASGLISSNAAEIAVRVEILRDGVLQRAHEARSGISNPNIGNSWGVSVSNSVIVQSNDTGTYTVRVGFAQIAGAPVTVSINNGFRQIVRTI